MKIVYPDMEIHETSFDGDDILHHIATFGRLCYQSEGKTSDADFVRRIIKSGHESVLEHVSFTFRIEGLSRAALAQLTRHRLASFDVESQRYVKMEDVRMVMPDSIARSDFLMEAETSLSGSMELYRRMTAAGIPAEDARYVTPQAVAKTMK